MPRIDNNQSVQNANKTTAAESGRIGKRSVEASGGLPRLDRIKGTEPPRGNFLTRAFESEQTKMTRTARSVDQHTGKLLGALDRPPGQALNSKALLSEIVTLRKHFDYMSEVSGKPVEPTGTLQLALAGRLGAMDNQQVMNLHRTFLSEDTTQLRSGLEGEIARNPANKEAKQCLEDLGVIEATLLMEIAGRVARSESRTPIAPLQERLAARGGHDEHGALVAAQGRGAVAVATQTAKLSDKGLEALVESGGRAAALHDKSLGADAASRLERKGFELNAREVGDTMRAADLTMNFNLNDFFGIGRAVKTIDDCTTMRNMFQWGVKPDENNIGALKRDMTERQFFESLQRSELDPDSRPMYGALNVGRQSKGGGDFYGASYFVLKPEVKQRCTYTIDDTFNVPLCKATPENLAALGEKINQLLPKLSEKGRTFLTEENGKNLQKLLAKLESNGEFTTTDLSQAINGMFGGSSGLSPEDTDRVAILIQGTLIDEHATHAQVTGYDNMENLLSHLGESRLNTMMMAAESPSKGNFRLGNYIEAQIHGTVAFNEDVAAMRISINDLEDVARASNGAYTAETAREKLVGFCEKNGIELSFYDDSADEINQEVMENQDASRKFMQTHADPEIRVRQQRDTSAALNAFIDDANTGPTGLTALLNSTCTDLGLNATDLNAVNIGRIKQDIAAAVGKASENGLHAVDANKIRDVARQATHKFVQTKADLLAEVDKLQIPAENKAVLRAFALGSSTLNSAKMLQEVAQSSLSCSAMLRMFADLPDLTDATRLDSVLGTLREFVADNGARLEDVFGALGKEWGRDDRMLYTERAASLGASIANLDKEALGKLYNQLTSAAGQELTDALRADARGTDATQNTRQTMADTLDLLTVMIGRELGKSRPEVENDQRHAMRFNSMQEVPATIQHSFEKLSLI